MDKYILNNNNSKYKFKLILIHIILKFEISLSMEHLGTCCHRTNYRFYMRSTITSFFLNTILLFIKIY